MTASLAMARTSAGGTACACAGAARSAAATVMAPVTAIVRMDSLRVRFCECPLSSLISRHCCENGMQRRVPRGARLARSAWRTRLGFEKVRGGAWLRLPSQRLGFDAAIGGCRSGRLTAAPVCELGENVIAALHQCVAREPALRVVPLRRTVRLGGGAERIGRCVVVE